MLNLLQLLILKVFLPEVSWQGLKIRMSGIILWAPQRNETPEIDPWIFQEHISWPKKKNIFLLLLLFFDKKTCSLRLDIEVLSCTRKSYPQAWIFHYNPYVLLTAEVYCLSLVLWYGKCTQGLFPQWVSYLFMFLTSIFLGLATKRRGKLIPRYNVSIAIEEYS